jgi:hypothetical protein
MAVDMADSTSAAMIGVRFILLPSLGWLRPNAKAKLQANQIIASEASNIISLVSFSVGYAAAGTAWHCAIDADH